jgi:hypothetical protein
MSGIAESWAQATNDYCFAGIWKSHLPLGFLWICTRQRFLQKTFQAYRAPSWSWASFDGHIDWFKAMFTSIIPTVEVKSCAIDLAHLQAPYGAVRSASLMIRGCYKNPYWTWMVFYLGTNRETEKLHLHLARILLDFRVNCLPPTSEVVSYSAFKSVPLVSSRKWGRQGLY